MLARLKELRVDAGETGCARRTGANERTGERLADAQAAALRLACENLAGAYRRLDGGASRGQAR